jgi:hypothetical protein
MFNVNIPKDAARSGLSRYIPIIGKKRTIIVKSKKYTGGISIDPRSNSLLLSAKINLISFNCCLDHFKLQSDT